jgi:hypothetical protein
MENMSMSLTMIVFAVLSFSSMLMEKRFRRLIFLRTLRNQQNPRTTMNANALRRVLLGKKRRDQL